ncbi:MAG: penicillin-binding protein 2 [Anaerolineae bacterium]|nr:penicillin-binding protein 2 [Anaerolineae bacterium]
MQRLIPFQGWRLTFFQGVIFAVFVLFSFRMYDLQVVQNEDWQLAADDNRLSELPIAAPRGVIFDRNGQTLAGNVPAYNVTIVPAALPDNQEEVLDIFNRLSALVNVPPTAALAAERGVRSIEELVDEGNRIAPFREVTVAEDVDLHVAMQILEEQVTLPGVAIVPIGVRQYPTGTLTAQVVGYMGPIGPEEAEALRELGYNPAYDRIGYSGVEFSLEEILSGQRGRELREVDVAGEVVNRISVEPAVPGQSVQLTIDTELQEAAQKALEDRITFINTTENRIRTQSGVVIALDPRNGQVLSLVSWPSYDNSRFARNIDYQYYLEVFNNTQTPLVNHAISSLYPPGSVWKVVSALGVLEEGVIAPETKLFDPGNLVLPNRYAPNDEAAAQNFVCWKRDGHGAVDMIAGIAQSCDVYFYQVGGGNPDISQQVLRTGGLGPTDLFRWATAMGIGSELGVELPSEQAGRMPDPDWKRRIYGENWSTGDTYNAAFGQGYLTVTPLQLVSAVASIVNGGTLYQPTIIQNLLDAEGNIVQPFQSHVMRNVNINHLDPNEPIKLLQIEDMIMKGEDSLACTCEPDSPFYNPLRCDPDNYVNTVNVGPDKYAPDLREYTVEIPFNYQFNGSICDENRFDPDYQPPFAGDRFIDIVRQGMRAAVTIGTAQPANLPYVNVAGKTGTAEYCDDVARPLGLCIPGSWPTHAWFTAFAPYEDPEIIIIGFVYNGGEGSLVALPVVVETMEAYYRLKNEREGLPAQVAQTP